MHIHAWFRQTLKFFGIWAPAYEILLNRSGIIHVPKVKHVICWKNSYVWWYLEWDCNWSDHPYGEPGEYKSHFPLLAAQFVPRRWVRTGGWQKKTFTFYFKAQPNVSEPNWSEIGICFLIQNLILQAQWPSSAVTNLSTVHACKSIFDLKQEWSWTETNSWA